MRMITRNWRVVLACMFCLVFACMCSSEKQAEETSSKQQNALRSLLPEMSFKGKIIFQSDFDGDNDIYAISMKGIKRLTNNSIQDEYPVFSPDGKKIAFSSNLKGQYDIYVMDEDGTDVQRVTSSSHKEETPAWFPDNKSIAYTKNLGGTFRSKDFLFMTHLDSQRTKKIITDFQKTHIIPWISPDGSMLTFTAKRTLGWDVALYDFEQEQFRFLEKGGKSCRGRFSPKGNKIAYVSSKADGKGDIWLMNPDGSQKKRLTQRDDTYDYFPSWSPDGKFIVFNSSLKHDHIGKLCIVKVKTGEVFFLFDSPGNDVYPDWK
ncbi:MAG: hypothetical protein GF421_06825 [Candidatus Aminicenantes bacterium]|nr:hypothetical protein [Candidatus Aminicenantes bacterium]